MAAPNVVGKAQRHLCGCLQWTAEFDRFGVVLGYVRQAHYTERQRDSGVLVGPVKEIQLGEFDFKMKWILRIGRVAGLHGCDIAMNAVKPENCLAEVVPMRLRCPAKREAKHEFRVAAKSVLNLAR